LSVSRSVGQSVGWSVINKGFRALGGFHPKGKLLYYLTNNLTNVLQLQLVQPLHDNVFTTIAVTWVAASATVGAAVAAATAAFVSAAAVAVVTAAPMSRPWLLPLPPPQLPFCRLMVDCCLPLLFPAPKVAKAVGANVVAAPSAAVFPSATAATIAATLTAISAAFG
jgi:hypothetical protein